MSRLDPQASGATGMSRLRCLLCHVTSSVAANAAVGSLRRYRG